jgi:peptidoglycan/LPS O-acetylase OafA/YrhL
MMATYEQPQRLQSIQAVRGVAANLVVLMHATNVSGAYSGIPSLQTAALRFQPIGHLGVDLFFVVSGLIIGQQVLRSRMSAQAFAWHRVLRIFPLYWITLVACILLPLPEPPLRGFAPLLDNPASLVLLTSTKLHPVAWTLVFEIHFYIVAAFALIFPKRAKNILLVWCLLQVALVMVAPQTALRSWRFATPVSLEFCLGLLIAFYGRYITIERPFTLIVTAFALMYALATVYGEDIARNTLIRLVVLGVPAAYVIAAALAIERLGTRIPAFLVTLGDVSYSTYVWHIPILALLWHLLPVRSIPGGLFFIAVSLTVCFVVSVASFRFLEKPLIDFGRRTMPPRLPVAAASVPTA